MCKTMVTFKCFCDIVDYKYVLIQLTAENECLLIAFVAHTTSSKQTNMTT